MVKKKNKQERKIERELIYIIGFLVFLVLVFFVASSIFKELGNAEYEGLTFAKEKFGELVFYHYSYFYKNNMNKLVQYNLYLRTNPVENDVVIEGDKVDSLLGSDFSFVAIKTTYLDCPESFAAVGTLSKFLADNGLNVKSANMDFTEAAIRNQTYARCEEYPNNNVIQIYRNISLENSKVLVNGNCYSIAVGNDCKIMQAVEKLEVHAIIDTSFGK